ncbi:MAG TPA: hypothetical protein VMT93_06045 [Gemmatimonadaceae bacterium]|nr:hypothetical protein [Gemmatimonadaceae bacterium]
MTMVACPHCGRQVSDQSARCLYCAKPLAGGGTEAEEKRAVMLRAMYGAGVGLERPAKRGLVDRLRDEPLAVRLLAAVPLLAMGLVWPPLAWRWMVKLFRP